LIKEGYFQLDSDGLNALQCQISLPTTTSVTLLHNAEAVKSDHAQTKR
jgi:hypothetical protein